MNPIEHSVAYDVAILGGQATPGQATLTGVGDPRKWDKRNGYGLSGATQVFTGKDISDFTLRLTFWDPADIEDYYTRIAPILAAPTTRKAKAIDFFHPTTAQAPHSIKAVIVKDVSGVEPDGDTGAWYVEIKLSSWKAPKKALVKPLASTPKTPPKQDEADKMIADLTTQLKSLG